MLCARRGCEELIAVDAVDEPTAEHDARRREDALSGQGCLGVRRIDAPCFVFICLDAKGLFTSRIPKTIEQDDSKIARTEWIISAPVRPHLMAPRYEIMTRMLDLARRSRVPTIEKRRSLRPVSRRLNRTPAVAPL